MLKMRRGIRGNQSGMVAIVVTLILILVLTLIVIAFMRVSRREEAQTLDRQLATEAFYAAETGVNDAARAFREAASGAPILTDDSQANNCNPSTMTSFNRQLEGNNITYSCLLIDPTPISLEYNSVNKGESKVVPIDLETPNGAITSVTIFWQQPEVAPDFSGCTGSGPFPASWPGSCSTGILRVDTVRVDNNFDRNELLSNTSTAFVVPRNGGAAGTVNFAATSGGAPAGSNQGAIVGAGCTSAVSSAHPKHCELRISGLNLSQTYYLRLTPLYRPATVTICAPDCTGAALELKNAQAQVDSTGRASDVLRRIQVRIGTDRISDANPLGAIESSNLLCKRLSIIPPSTVNESCP